jgi:hypothetical protein
MITLGADSQAQVAEALRVKLNAGGTFVIYSGTPPANAQAALSGNTVLATHTLPSFSRSGAVVSAGAVSDVTPSANGTASFFRCIVSGVSEIQGTVTTSGGGGDAIVNSLTYSTTGTSRVTSMAFTAPA